MKITEGILGLAFKSFKTRTYAIQNGDKIIFIMDILNNEIKITIKKSLFLEFKEWINSLPIK